MIFLFVTKCQELQITNAAEIRRRKNGGCGGTNQKGRIPERDRELPLPSPAANLAGIWKSEVRRINRPYCRLRLFMPPTELFQEEAK